MTESHQPLTLQQTIPIVYANRFGWHLRASFEFADRGTCSCVREHGRDPMATPDSSPGHGADPRRKRAAVGRRRFLTYLVAAPPLTIAAKLGLDAAAPARAAAAV